MRDKIGAILVALAAWLGYRASADAAATAAGVSPAPAAIPDRLTVGYTRLLVERINAAEFGGWFRVGDVLAIIEIESGFRPRAFNHERAGTDDDSRGLMQVQLQTAWDRGFPRGVDPAALFDPETGIRYGMRQLRWTWDYLESRFQRPPTMEEWSGAYNAGVGNVYRNGFIQVAYVQKFREARGRYG